jgi:molybdenum cofactor guanylyltransferase
MLGRMIALLQNVAEEVKVVGAREKYDQFEREVVSDRWPSEGPLGGIITALENSGKSAARTRWNVIVSCDMPFLTRESMEFLVERAAVSEAQVVVPRSSHGPEPLCACWRTDAAETLRTAFERGVRKVTDGIALLRSEVLDEPVWKRFDSAGRLFWNMNTAADFEEVRRVWETERA